MLHNSSQYQKLIFTLGLFCTFHFQAMAAEEFPLDSSNPLSYIHEQKIDPRCDMIPDKGPCKAMFFNYFYDKKTKSCKEFIYGGCDGVVPFETKEECEKNCVYNPKNVVKKPAIYLYPSMKSKINVSLHINGEITKTIPKYKNTWNVIVDPDGNITGGYDYLFYEAALKKITLPKEGWVVSYKDLNRWFDVNLVKLGLNAKEKRQFIEYWIKELPVSPYYKIQLLDTKFLADNMNLVITPKPDTLIRLDFYFTPIQRQESIKEPMSITPQRKGFTVVEWGGILNNSKIKKVQ